MLSLREQQRYHLLQEGGAPEKELEGALSGRSTNCPPVHMAPGYLGQSTGVNLDLLKEKT